MKMLVKCNLGIPMPELLAREVDALMKTLPKECTYRKKAALPSESELVHGERADISLVSVESVDRDGEVVLAKGMDVTLFGRNPIVTFAHNYSELPVGKAAWVKKVKGGIKAKTQYSVKPVGWEGNWFPDAVFSMVQEGILKGKSVGFIPTYIRSPTKEEIANNPTWKNASAIIETATLLEYAIAPVPVNQDALVQAVAKGFADEATLARLGLHMPKVKAALKKRAKPIDIVAMLDKELGKMNITADGIIKALASRYEC